MLISDIEHFRFLRVEPEVKPGNDTQATNPMSGDETFGRKKFVRKVVKRVIMGPVDLWNPALIADELASFEGALSVWGLLRQQGNPVQPQQFLEGLLPSLDSKPLVGTINIMEGKNLCKPASWTDPKLLDFGSTDLEVLELPKHFWLLLLRNSQVTHVPHLDETCSIPCGGQSDIERQVFKLAVGLQVLT